MDQTTDEINQDDALPSQEFMMLCLPGSDGRHDLRQVEFTRRPATNADFLARLKFVYEMRRSDPFPSWGVERKLTGLRFVRFRTIYTSDPTPRVTVRVRVSHCLPRGEEGWDSGESLHAAASTKAMLAGLKGLYTPDNTPEGLSFYDLCPRKLQDPLAWEGGLCGWGLYVVEEEHRKWWCKGVVLVHTVVVGYLAGIVIALLAHRSFGLAINGFGFLALRSAVMWFVWRNLA